jgi:hypothetical protein
MQKEQRVNLDSNFENSINTLLVWRKRRRLLSFLIRTLTFSLILNALALGFQKMGYVGWNGVWIYFILIVPSLGFALVLQHLTSKNLLSDLIEIDSRLLFKDRLSTAYEYRQSGKKTLLKEKLFADAGRALGGLSKNKLFPIGFSSSYILIPLASFFIFSLLLFDWSLPQSQGETTPEKLAWIGKEMEKFSKEKIVETKALEDRSLGEPYLKLEELAKELQNQSLKREKLLLALGELKQAAEAERLRITRKLEQDLNAGPTPGNAGAFSLSKEITTPKDVEKLAERLKDLFDGTLPDSLAKDLSRLRQKLQLEQFLESTEDQAASPGPAGEERFLLSKREKVFTGENAQRENSGKIPSLDTKPSFSKGKDQTKIFGPPESEPGKGEKPQDGKGTQDREDDRPFTAGRGRGTGEKVLPFEFKGGKGDSVKERGAPSSTESESAFQVRTLPRFGKPKEDREGIVPQIPASYRQEMEAVLHKEKIPREYRDYIKNYFLSIRQEKGKKQNEKSH